MAIINPWWFYLIDVLGSLKDICYNILGGIIAIIAIIAVIDLIMWLFDDREWDYLKKAFKIGLSVFIPCLILYGVIPSEKTMYTMMVANFVTHENVEIATEAIQYGVDYVFEKLNGDESE